MGTVWTGATEGIELLYGGSVSKFSKSIWEEGRRHFTVVAGVDLSVFDGRVLSTDRNEKRQEVGIPQEAKLAMMISRMISWKGHTDLVSAMKFLPQYVHLALVGWGLLENELKTSPQGRDYRENSFLGARSDVPELLKTADVYIQAHSRATDGSIWMGPNTSQMEACAASIPSVSTAVPLIESLIEDGVTGVLAEPNNPKDLARAIAWILEHKDEAKNLRTPRARE